MKPSAMLGTAGTALLLCLALTLPQGMHCGRAMPADVLVDSGSSSSSTGSTASGSGSTGSSSGTPSYVLDPTSNDVVELPKDNSWAHQPSKGVLTGSGSGAGSGSGPLDSTDPIVIVSDLLPPSITTVVDPFGSGSSDLTAPLKPDTGSNQHVSLTNNAGSGSGSGSSSSDAAITDLIAHLVAALGNNKGTDYSTDYAGSGSGSGSTDADASAIVAELAAAFGISEATDYSVGSSELGSGSAASDTDVRTIVAELVAACGMMSSAADYSSGSGSGSGSASSDGDVRALVSQLASAYGISLTIGSGSGSTAAGSGSMISVESFFSDSATDPLLVDYGKGKGSGAQIDSAAEQPTALVVDGLTELKDRMAVLEGAVTELASLIAGLAKPAPQPQLPQPSTPINLPKTDFVRVNGTQFSLNGKPFWFQGTNIYYLGPASINGRENDTFITHQMEQLAARHIRVVRFWGFGLEYEAINKTADGGWTLTDEAFDRLDLVIYLAAKHGMKVVFPFINHEPNWMGTEWFVTQVLGFGDRELFYADSRVYQRYMAYVASIINHFNPRTGRLLKDEPAVLAWELMNEPHTSDGYESKFTVPLQYGDMGINLGPGQLIGRLVNQWMCRASADIHKLDPNHMVTSGEEGYRAYGDLDSPDASGDAHTWVNNGLKGGDFEMNARCPGISYTTVHVYPDNWAIPFPSYQWVVKNYIEDRASISHKLHKPIVMEEYGCCKDADYKGHRRELFRTFHDAVDRLGYAGSMVWQIMPATPTGLGMDPNYDFTFADEGAEEIFAHARYMESRTRGDIAF